VTVPIRTPAPWTVVLLLACLVTPACLGKGLRFDAQRLQRKCRLAEGEQVTLDQARCIAKVAGLKEGRKCPFEIVESVDEDRGPTYDVQESCSGIGIRIARASGEIVGVDFGEAAAP